MSDTDPQRIVTVIYRSDQGDLDNVFPHRSMAAKHRRAQPGTGMRSTRSRSAQPSSAKLRSHP
jgi:hypothetical protein